MATSEIDLDAAQAFGGRILGVMNDAMLALAVSLGHRSGLYEAMAAMPPATSAEIAEAAGLQERYVREWLAAQVTGGVCDHDPERGTYALPPERAACLTGDGPHNLAVLAPFTARFGELEDDLLACFRDGGGLPQARMARLEPLQARLARPIVDGSLVDGALPLVPGLVERLRSGIDVLDLGCGDGRVAMLIADAFPLSRVTGYDQSPSTLAAAQDEAERLGLGNVRFEVRDAEALEPAAFDLVAAFDVIHHLADPERGLRAIHRAIRPGGALLMVEHRLSDRLEENLGHPLLPALYVVSLFHCMTVSLAEGGEGVGIAWGERQARAALAAAGFADVEVGAVEADVFNAYYVAQRR